MLRHSLSRFAALHTPRYAARRWLSRSSSSTATNTAKLKDPASDVVVTLHESSLSLTAPSLGLTKPFHFDHVWLRDACSEESSVQSSTKQKVFHTSDVDIPPAQHGLLDT